MPDCNSNHSESVMSKTKHPDDLFGKRESCIAKKSCFEVEVLAAAGTAKTGSPLSSSTMTPVTPDPVPPSPPTSARKFKKAVSFNDDSLVEVFEFEDDLESKEGRKLFWEFCAVDRYRFKDRIERMEPLLSPILTSAHRNGIYSKRMVTTSSTSTTTISTTIISATTTLNLPPPIIPTPPPPVSVVHSPSIPTSIPFFVQQFAVEIDEFSVMESSYAIRSEVKVE